MSLVTFSLFWLLVKCWAFLDLTVGATHALQITQHPRFYGVMTSKVVGIYCKPSEQSLLPNVTWHKAERFGDETSPIGPEGRRSLTKTGLLILKDLRLEDQGVYFCKIGDVSGPGTEVQVAKPVNLPHFLSRSQRKDELIILQGLLLALIIAAFVFRKKALQSEKQDYIYEEPEVDHIYEGLAIETCEEGDLYEEISAYAQAEETEAPWE